MAGVGGVEAEAVGAVFPIGEVGEEEALEDLAVVGDEEVDEIVDDAVFGEVVGEVEEVAVADGAAGRERSSSVTTSTTVWPSPATARKVALAAALRLWLVHRAGGEKLIF